MDADSQAERLDAENKLISEDEQPSLAVDDGAILDEANFEPTETSETLRAAQVVHVNEIEPARLYARNPELAGSEPVPTYQIADVRDVGTPNRGRFYDRGYLAELRKMVDHVVETEGPLYFDLLVERIARAHGFQRAKDGIRGVVKTALGQGRFPVTKDEGSELIWPKDGDPTVLPPWRGPGSRQHGDVPLPELASLAATLRAIGLEGEDLVRAMQDRFRLGRLAGSTRERFEAAASYASKLS